MSRLIALALLGVSGPALAQDIWYQDVVQGGLSIDTSGVSTPYDVPNGGVGTWYAGDDLQVQIPSGADIEHVYAFVTAKWQGFGADLAQHVRLNGVLLDQATVLGTDTRVVTYELDPATYGIFGTGPVTYEELDFNENTFHSGSGVGGTTLAVVYRAPDRESYRYVVLGTNDVTDGSFPIAMPDQGISQRGVLSLTLGWECSDEQNAVVNFQGTTLSAVAGGRDDGDDWNTACGSQDGRDS
jgi:hypothetical protein